METGRPPVVVAQGSNARYPEQAHRFTSGTLPDEACSRACSRAVAASDFGSGIKTGLG